jgi:hypothetical protein
VMNAMSPAPPAFIALDRRFAAQGSEQGPGLSHSQPLCNQNL